MLTNVLNAGKDIANKIGNKIMNLSEIEAKIKEATNDDPWGPQCYIMQEISDETFSSMNFNEIMNFLWFRIFTERPTNGRRVYKGLILLSYLLLNGSDYVALRSKCHIDDLQGLKTYSEINGAHDSSIRKKSVDICELILNKEKLQIEREKARASHQKVYSKKSTLTADPIGADGSDNITTSLGEFESWQPRSKSIPLVIGESLINLVTTLSQNISGPPPTETHDNFELPSLNMAVQTVDASKDLLSPTNIGTVYQKDAINNCNKNDHKNVEELAIIDFSETTPIECNRISEDDFGEFHCWDSPVLTSDKALTDDFFPDFDSLDRTKSKPFNSGSRSPDYVHLTSQETRQNKMSKSDLKLGSTWNDIGSLKIDLDNVCGSRRPMSTKS